MVCLGAEGRPARCGRGRRQGRHGVAGGWTWSAAEGATPEAATTSGVGAKGAAHGRGPTRAKAVAARWTWHGTHVPQRLQELQGCGQGWRGLQARRLPRQGLWAPHHRAFFRGGETSEEDMPGTRLPNGVGALDLASIFYKYTFHTNTHARIAFKKNCSYLYKYFYHGSLAAVYTYPDTSGLYALIHVRC